MNCTKIILHKNSSTVPLQGFELISAGQFQIQELYTI